MSSYVQVTIINVKSQSAWDVESQSLHMQVSDFAPFLGKGIRVITKITHAHNLHVKLLDFGPFTIRT